MKTAVLMSTYNGEQYLTEQVNSILSQRTDADFDLIVRDDGSKDRTVQILESYSNKGQLKFYVGENIGAAQSFIALLQDNPGYDFYAFSDQDDIWYPDKLQRGINAITGISGPAIYCTNCELVDSNMHSLGRNVHRKVPTYSLESILCLASCAQGCTSVFNSELAQVIQERPVPDIFVMHDSLLTCLCGLIDGIIIYDDRPSMKYRMHNENVVGMVTAKQGIVRVLKDRIIEITQKRKISMYAQTEGLLTTYGDRISQKNQQLCRLVIESEHSLRARLKLVLDDNLKHDTLNKTITKKLEILFGND